MPIQMIHRPHRPTSRVELTQEQRDAVEHLLRFRSDVQTMGGYAGTGKTTVIKTLHALLPRFAVCAFTGKATQVLRRKGVQATTIHSLIYRPVDAGGETEWLPKEREELAAVGVQGFIVDEASMVGELLCQDLTGFGLPIVFVGDHGQLEPVGDRGFNLMEHPDVTLETIHRNAGEIARFAEHLRKGNPAKDWKMQRAVKDRQVHFVSAKDMHRLDLAQLPDQMICAFNQTRVAMNRTARAWLGFEDPRRSDDPASALPVAGDRVMCLQNDRETGLFNGMQGTVSSAWLDSRFKQPMMRFRHLDPFGGAQDEELDLQVNRHSFHRQSKPSGLEDPLPFDYAYCVTCHKFQGDEAEHVMVLEQRCKHWDHSRWSYTAASRARSKLTWVGDF